MMKCVLNNNPYIEDDLKQSIHQQNSEVQWTTCSLHATRAYESKEEISSTLFEYGGYEK